VGHNPLGAWSVLLFLALLSTQVVTGLLSDDEIAFYGPWSPLVSGDWVSWATNYHQNIGKFLLLILIAMHLLAMVFYVVVRHKNLVPAMVHGDKYLSPLTTASSDTTARRVLALVIWLLCAGLVLWTTSLS
jgi:cytochrome b